MKKLLLLIIPLLLIASLSCKKKSEPDPIPYASFKISGVAKSLNYASNFSKDFCSTSTFCCRFTATNDTTNQETLKFGIPGDPIIVNKVYCTNLYRFSCFYMNKSGVRYDLTGVDSSFTVVFTQWDGQGGWGKGHFSGWMKSPENDSILFQDGYFQNKIWTMGKE